MSKTKKDNINFKKTVYYAHCMAIYDSKQEKEDVAVLEQMGFEVDNPNSQKHILEVRRIKCEFSGQQYPGSKIMKYFTDIVLENQLLAFRALPDGSISAGVNKEIRIAEENKIPIFELPDLKNRIALSIAETRRYLRNN